MSFNDLKTMPPSRRRVGAGWAWRQARAVLGALLLATGVAGAADYSALWGRNGELWTPQSRLPDFSWAGYHCGEKAPPVLPPGVSVKKFGAKGDGVADDTQAFLDALEKAPVGAIEVPPGHYKITKILEITRSGMVLRGVGPDKSVLVCPVPLNEIKPNWGATTTGKRTSNYSWNGGIVWIKGNLRPKPLTTITAEAPRGTQTLTVSSSERLKVGQRVQIYESDTPENTLAEHLYSGDPGPTQKLKGSARAALVCHVTKITGNQISFDRPLRCDVKLLWQPSVRSFEPSVTEAGVERLGFEFPNTPYPGHFNESGFNAVALAGCSDCWVRDLRILNADSGLYLNCNFCTAQNIVIESARKPDKNGSTGHHGVSFSGADNLFIAFDYRTQFVHDISVDGGACGNVVAGGKGVDLCLDHHKHACYENLFANLDAGLGTHLWRHGGGADLGKACAARGTFWNIRARKPQVWPPDEFGPPSMNLVAIQTLKPTAVDPAGKWFEAFKPETLFPQDIHQAQLALRLAAHPAR